MKFTKMHGCGNDYVYVDCTEHMLADPSAAAIAVATATSAWAATD